MVTIADIKQWKPEVLHEVADLIRQRSQVLIHSGDDYNRLMPMASWSGPAADAAHGTHKQLMTVLESLTVAVTGVGKGLAQASDAIPPLKDAIESAEELGRKYGFTVGDDGNLTDTFAGQDPPPEMHPEDRARAHDQVVADLQQVIRTAEDIDNDLDSLFFRATAAEAIDFHQGTVASAAAQGLQEIGLTLPDPPANGTPAQNAAWWATLSGAGKSFYIQGNPERVGALDGLPGADRDTANRAVLGRQQADLRRQRDDLQHRLDGMKESDPRQMDEYHELEDQRDKIDGKLAELGKVKEVIDKPGGRQLLVLDGSGDHVKAAVASGNVDTARNIATFTGGFGSTVQGDLNDYDDQMDRIRRDASEMAWRSGKEEESAAVTWMGYDAPQSADVVTTGKAEAGAGKLTPFLQGLDAARGDDPARQIAIGHSYGSTTTGLALRHADVDAAIFAGSPGIDTHNLGDLHVPPGQSYVLKNHDDPVAKAGVFGGPPETIEGMRRLSTEHVVRSDGQELDSSTGHSSVKEYLRPGTTSQHNISAVVAGIPDQRDFDTTSTELPYTPGLK
ncbi:alpha/beta hydrolase [Amycolatopsis minnesotensis]|uniref:Alpha/beta hydrolase n=1 Tax=Amycolatopsis minnesotensis TaxID=337894 RepID=A0ABP5DYD5_9PSEU